MLFSKRYSDLLSQNDADKQEDFFGTINFTTKKDIVGIIDNYNGLLKTTSDDKSYTYDIDGAKYVVYVKEEKICKVTYEKDNLVYTLEYNYL